MRFEKILLLASLAYLAYAEVSEENNDTDVVSAAEEDLKDNSAELSVPDDNADNNEENNTADEKPAEENANQPEGDEANQPEGDNAESKDVEETGDDKKVDDADTKADDAETKEEDDAGEKSDAYGDNAVDNVEESETDGAETTEGLEDNEESDPDDDDNNVVEKAAIIGGGLAATAGIFAWVKKSSRKNVESVSTQFNMV
ncbi:hypothetical protein BCR32DRAFT_329429 [Anaeromyces robustus]|jgi:hypothetical protein|uniref:Uncharacterized protein n=1 Tax=Anaeromyces robustus TaxID=1754192 RepID=A0A1Y1WRY5_9FUNG|nr:hypothetical protein BCR32DRAFT_329429 [Anaeromyces robustus]|eukprot:ORX76297.1 hypothetical protein BCR32DRAFT_329429 [Anaeromyces robustus]